MYSFEEAEAAVASTNCDQGPQTVLLDLFIPLSSNASKCDCEQMQNTEKLIPMINSKYTDAHMMTLRPDIYILSGEESYVQVATSVAFGARGFLGKSTLRTGVVEPYLWAALLGAPLFTRAPLTDAKQTLTRREAEVTIQIEAGKSTKEMAKLLNLSVHTVDSYIKTSMSKLGLNRRSELCAWVQQNGATLDALVGRAG